MIKQQIISALKEALEEMGLSGIEPELEVPSEPSHGDWSTNVALVLAKKAHKVPMELAEQIIAKLEAGSKKLEFIEKIKVEKPGFINFWLSKDYMVKWLHGYIAKNHTAISSHLAIKGKRIMVEFTDPNPFKEFHIGHLYSNVVGESLCRLLESQGAQVWRVTYQGDIGLHVAKALYGIINDDSGIKSVESGTAKDKANFLGKCYAAGSRAHEESENAKKEINKINKKIYEGSDSAITELYQKGRQWSLDYFESIYQRLGTKFVKNYFESIAGPIGLTLVRNHIKDGVFRESEGAIIFEGKKHGLHNRVFINSLGLPTYEAKDMGLPPTKYKDFQYDESIIITAEEQSGYFEVVFKALSFINPDLAAKTRHIAHGVVRLPQGKMSSRTGNIITGEWLLDEAKAKIKERFGDIGEEVAEQVAVGAVKYALLKSSLGKDIAFSFEESINLEGNSGPYLQYTYARTRSVLGKAGGAWRVASRKPRATSYELRAEEVTLLRLLHRFPEIVEEAAQKFAPNLLCEYLFALAQNFNLFYQKHKILPNVIPSEGMHQTVRPEVEGSLTTQTLLNKIPPRAALSRNDNVSLFRLSLTSGVGHTLQTGLYLLGIKSPQKM